jgi:hypothetical protein
MKTMIAMMLLVVAAPALAEDAVSVSEAADGGFVATLTSEGNLPIEEAQALLMPSAKAACGSSTPVFGRYRFESTQPMTQPAAASFSFMQEFRCGETQRPPPGIARRTGLSEAETQQLVARVVDETRTFLATADEEVFTDFHAKFSGPLAEMLPLDQFKAEQAALHSGAGGIQGLPLTKVTIYADPPDSPVPGTYVAVDFQARYERTPYRCGYVMWVLDRESRLSVMRIEDGSLSSKDVAALTAPELANAKAAFRCFAP